MWMDIAQQDGGDPHRNSEDEDTVQYDRTNPFYKSPTKNNPFEQNGEEGSSRVANEGGNSPNLELRSMLHEHDTQCGIFTWRPHFLQRFSENKAVFSVIFTIVGILHSSVWSYYTANISTIEKRFRMDSITSGVLLFSNELAQLLIAVLFSYFNLRHHRHKLLTIGVALTSISCFLMASPHFFMGSGETALNLINPSGPLIEPTFITVPDSNGGFEFQEMKVPELAAPLVQLQTRQASLTSTPTPITTITTTTKDIQNVYLSSSASPTTDGVTVSEVITADLQDNLTSTSMSPQPSTSKSTPTPSPTTLPEVNDDPTITPTTRSLPPSLASDEMTSIWPICHRDIEHLNSSTCDSEPIFERKLTFLFIFLANSLFGLSSMLFLISGGPFSEPTTIFPNEIPRIFSITLSIRLIGSFFGYLFAYTCLSSFINPFETPIQIDNRFLGAYWLGWLSLSLLFAGFALILSLFPRQSPRQFLKKRSITHDTGIGMLLISSIAPFFGGAELKSSNVLPSILNIPGAYQGLIRNKVYLLLTLSSITHIFCSVGYLTFLPKYLEFMFRVRANDAALLTGVGTVPFQVAGLMLGGAFIARYLPSSKEISHWSCVVGALNIVGLMVMGFLGCRTNGVDVSWVGGGGGGEGHCSGDCECGRGPPLPVCDLWSGRTYYSGCHAGCESVRNESGVWGDCSCLGDGGGDGRELVEGWCPGDGCGNGLVAFLVFLCLGEFLKGSGVVGRMLLGYKAVQADQRTAIIGLTLFILSVFALIPSPIVFGSLFEAACLVREESSCGNAHSNGTEDSGGPMGNCWLYDDASLRFIYNLGTAAFMVIAFVLDAVLWKNKEVHELRIYDGELRQLTSHSGGEGRSGNARFASVNLT